MLKAKTKLGISEDQSFQSLALLMLTARDLPGLFFGAQETANLAPSFKSKSAILKSPLARLVLKGKHHGTLDFTQEVEGQE